MTLILIDFDGGLADARAARAAALSVALDEAGLGMADRLRAARDGLDALACDPATRDAVTACAEAHLLDTIESGFVRLRPGVGRFLAEAMTARMPVAILPTGGSAVADALLYIRFGPDMLAEVTRPWGGAEPPVDGDLAEALRLLHRPPGNVAFIGADAARVARAGQLGMFTVHTPYPDLPPVPRAADLTISDLGLPQVPFRVYHGHAKGHPCLTPAALADLMKTPDHVAA